MKVMFVVYHDLQYEARSQEMMECATRLGDSMVVSYSEPIDSEKYKHVITGNGKKKYMSFLIGTIKAIRENQPEIIILHDNYTTPLLWYINKYFRNTYIIYDSSELYIEKKFPKSLRQFFSEALKYFEKSNIKHSDTIIAANVERANIMKEFYNLKEQPLVFDNIHRIEDMSDIELCNKKYEGLFKESKFKIIYGGGISKGRLTYELTEAVKVLGDNYQLVVVGSATNAEIGKFHYYLESNEINNVKYLGFLPRNEWRYLLKMSDISVSVFNEDTLNNKNCASGKLYESLFENIPVLTSENPPLKRLCETFKIGVSTNDFVLGIRELESDYGYYVAKVNEFINTIDFEKRIDNLALQLREKIVMSEKFSGNGV